MHRFFHLYFKGGRYDDQHGLPLAALPALAKIERLVRAVARDLFFDGNEERKRVSAGFDDTFIPAITHLYGGGSVDCDLSWSPPERGGNTEYFEAARTEIVEILEGFTQDQPRIPPWLSRESTQLLADVLESIEDGESVRWDATEGEEVTVDHAVRLRIHAEAIRPRTVVEEAFHIVGRLHRISDDPWSVGVHIWETKRTITVPIQQHLKSKITEAWKTNDQTLIRLSGIATKDADGHRHFVETTNIRTIGGPSLTARIEALAAIKDGWLGDEEPATVPTRRFLVTLERSLWALIERVGVDRPYIFLHPDATIEAMWKPTGKTVSLRFASSGTHQILGVAVDRSTRTVDRTEPVTALENLDKWLCQQLGLEA